MYTLEALGLRSSPPQREAVGIFQSKKGGLGLGACTSRPRGSKAFYFTPRPSKAL